MAESPIPGTYIIHDTDSGQALTHYTTSPHPNKIGSWRNHQEAPSRIWYVKRYPGSSRYAIQNVPYNKYVAINKGADNEAHGAEEDGAAILELEHQSQDSYLIKLTGTKYRLEHPKVDIGDGRVHTVMRFTDKDTLQGCVWRFEKIGDNAGSPLKPRPEASVTPSTPSPIPPPVFQSNLLSPNSGSLYTDDAWYVKRYPEGSVYAIQNMASKKYVPSSMDGSDMRGVDESDAAIFSLEHQFQDFYLIKLFGTKVHLEHPNIGPRPNDEEYTPVNLANKDMLKDTLKGCFWRFEKIGDDAGSALAPRVGTSNSAPSVSQPSPPPSQGSGRLYPDDAHLYTDMLFNIPRMPFNRDQRIAALDWARRLGATNVPTIESLDECEGRLEAVLGGNNVNREA
ncbi:hypothetical protein FRC11_006800 [Ceratobasidium sp. 423]|nr:hypothetical protein FRC11_006800 [Ceratobasidium sp. 423]